MLRNNCLKSLQGIKDVPSIWLDKNEVRKIRTRVFGPSSLINTAACSSDAKETPPHKKYHFRVRFSISAVLEHNKAIH